jgi:hypothetical protein
MHNALRSAVSKMLFRGILAALAVGSAARERLIRSKAYGAGVVAKTLKTEAEPLAIPVCLTSSAGWRRVQRCTMVVPAST